MFLCHFKCNRRGRQALKRAKLESGYRCHRLIHESAFLRVHRIQCWQTLHVACNRHFLFSERQVRFLAKAECFSNRCQAKGGSQNQLGRKEPTALNSCIHRILCPSVARICKMHLGGGRPDRKADSDMMMVDGAFWDHSFEQDLSWDDSGTSI